MAAIGDIVVAAIFGDPIEHSKSPAMHNAAYAALGMSRTYAAFRVTAGNLAPALRAIPALGIIGVNLTVPHKQAAARLIKDLSGEARMLGAVNCVVNRRGVLRGDNTDARGLERDLRDLGCELRGRLAIVIGAGGGAASSVLACFRLGANRVVIVNRTPARAAALARRFSARGIVRAASEPRGLDALMDSALLADARLIVNATSMGLTTGRFARLDYSSTAADCLFYDLIYSGEPTEFVKPAVAAGRRAADGAGMLVNQGELAFKLFNRIAPPAGVMRAALFDALGRAQS
ncbi:shikimate dehydrogenase [Candidatus Binatus sp.]|uniref:shikimate dehydrogenase n=3 Tax=Candidatus Binatus sp. TaxID=2811406 RepID=UPI003C74D1A2